MSDKTSNKNSNIKPSYVSGNNSNRNSNIKSDYVSDKILTKTLILSMTMLQTKF